MAQPYEIELSALRNLVLQARELLAGIKLPEKRAERAHELLNAAVALTDDLLTVTPTAAALGRKGGTATAKRGSEYYRQIAAKRKTKAGGRPKRDSTQNL